MQPQDMAHDELLARLGTTRQDEAPRSFTAGELSVQFEGGALRNVRYRNQELVRAISFLVRDENWGTCDTQISGLQVEQGPTHFSLTFQALCGPHGDDLSWQATIAGHADGRLDVDVTAQVHRALLTNRTGFVVLHPLEVSGLPVTVEHVDGQVVQDRFPQLINPLQPFMDIRALTTQHPDGLSAEVRMEGDTFEMEDQRNWSDASFKTYVRPLALPWPYTLDAGTQLRQAVRLKVVAETGARTVHPGGSSDATVEVPWPAAGEEGFPRLSIGVRAADLEASLAQAAHLAALKPACFIGHLDLRHDDVASSLRGFARLVEAAGVPYDLELVLSDDPSPDAVTAQLSSVLANLTRAPRSLQLSSAADLKAVLPGSPWPPSPSTETMLGTARKLFGGIALGAGSFAYFTELNRKRPDAALLDYLSFTTCPIVHAADDHSVMQTLTTLPYIARSARALYSGLPYRVGPSSIAARDNPYGSATTPNTDGDDAARLCLTDNDPRQRGLFGAAWNLAYFAQFAAHGAGQIALSELTGPRGLLHGNLPTPLFFLLQSLALAPEASLVPVTIKADAQGRHPYALAAWHDGQLLLWVTNPSAQSLTTSLALPGSCQGLQMRRWELGARPGAPVWTTMDTGVLPLGAYETVQVAARLAKPGAHP